MTYFFGDEASHEVIRLLEEAGYEAVFVGGAVRDHVLDKQPEDIDIATSAEPEEVKAIFPNTIDVGIEHGTVLVINRGEPIEVTTYRTEGTYSDARRPDEVHFVKSLREDLLRRDFTMNALAMTREGKLIDLFGGIGDMEAQLIRAVGNPLERFQEDALRMLRAIRFSSALDFDIEEDTLLAIQESAELIRQISVERLKVELDKLFLGKNPVKAFDYLVCTELGAHLPLMPKRFEHLADVLPFSSAVEGWAFLTVIGRYSAAEMAKVFKLSNEEKKFISAVCEAFMKRAHQLFSIDDYYKYDLAVLVAAEKFFHAAYPTCQTLTVLQLRQQKESLPIQSIKELAVNGKDLIEWSGVRAGKWTGEWIGKIEHAVLHGSCENDPIKIKEWFMNDFKRET